MPERLRRLTVDEAIAIRTFRPDYQFAGPQRSAFKQVGNAVPCKLTEAVASIVYQVLTEGHKVFGRRRRQPVNELALCPG